MKEFVSIEGYRLAYQSVNAGRSRFIFFVHGNSGSAAMWRKQITSPLLSDFHLIVFDLPCHGDSDAFGFPQQPLGMTALARSLNAAVPQIAGDKPFVIVGLSLGSCVAAEMIRQGAPATGIALLGSCLWDDPETLGRIAYPDTGVEAVFMDTDKRSVERYLANCSSSADPADRDAFVRDYFLVRPGWRAQLLASLGEATKQSEWTVLKEKAIPALFIFGADEKIIDPFYLDRAGLPVWRDEVFRIAGASHLVNVDSPEPVNELLAEYAAECFKPE